MQVGQKQLTPFFNNSGGLNLTDSTFTIKPEQATGGYNYEYVKTGGIQKSLCPSRLNASADAQLRTLGLALRNTKANAKSIIRAAGRKIQLTSLVGTFSNLTEDTAAAGSDFLAADTEIPVVDSMTTTPSTDVLWLAGGGMAELYGVTSDTRVTRNGVEPPAGTLTPMVQGSGGDFATVGTYRYAFVYRKRSTQALSNAGVEAEATITLITNSVVLPLSGLTNLDTTKYDQVYIYRSAVGGAEEFTTGDLIAQLDSTEASYTDTGTSITEADNIPRAGSDVLDNSVVTAGAKSVLTLFKRRLVTAIGSSIYLSDLNKFESWPIENVIEVPSGGAITGLAVISFTTPTSTGNDEYLAIFKETELWILTGDDIENWSLKIVDDKTGCIAQPLIVSANGYLYFVDNRGFYLWDGAGKPVYISRPIEELFGVNGTIDRSKLGKSFGVFFKRQNQVVWVVSDSVIGEQKYVLKLDIRLTLPMVSNTLGQRILDGVFLQGKIANAAYAGASFNFPTSSSQEDVFITGDAAGYLYRQLYTTTGVGANDYDFSYVTKDLDLGRPAVVKKYEKVIAWVENLGNWDLTLDYWADYRASDNNKNTTPVTINANTDGSVALWDVAKWDVARWDDYQAQPKAIVFNLQAAPYNNSEGDVIKLRFRNSGSDEPIMIYGFSILWTEAGMRK